MVKYVGLAQDWRPSWKMAAILDFQVANVFFVISDPKGVSMQSLVLVSKSERLSHLFPPLSGKNRVKLDTELKQTVQEIIKNTPNSDLLSCLRH